MRQESKCGKCKHPVVFFNGRYHHTDYEMISDLCLDHTCECREPEPEVEEMDG